MPTNMNCPQCGAPLSEQDTECRYCGEQIKRQMPQQQYQNNQPYQPYQPQQQYQQQPQQPYTQNVYVNQMNYDGVDPSWPIKSKVVAGILAIFLGGLGIHKFYMGKIGMGIVYLLFCWTYIPSIVGFIEGIIYLCSDDHNFQVKNRVRIK